MDATRDIRQIDVDNIDDEIYYREIQGCATRVEGSGICAVVNCGRGEIRLCEHAGHRKARMNAEGLAGISSYDAPC